MSVSDIPNKIRRLLGLKASNETSRKRRIDVINEPEIFAKHRRISHDFPNQTLEGRTNKPITNNLFNCHFKGFRVTDDIFNSLSYKSPKSRSNTSMNSNGDFIIGDDSDEEDDWGTAHTKSKLNIPQSSFIKSSSTSYNKNGQNRVPDLHPINRLPSTNKKYNNLPLWDTRLRSFFTFELKNPTLINKNHCSNVALNKPIPIIRLPSSSNKNNNISPLDSSLNSLFSFEKKMVKPTLLNKNQNNNGALNKQNSIIAETQRRNDRKSYEELLLKMSPQLPFRGKAVPPPRIIKTIDLDKYESSHKLPDVDELLDNDIQDRNNCFSYFSQKKNISKLERTNFLEKTKLIANGDNVDNKGKETQQLDVNPINTLKEKLDLIPAFNDSWITNLNQRYSDNLLESKKLISEEHEHVNKLSQATRKQEMQLHQKLKDFMIISETITLDDSEDEEEAEDNFPELTNNDQALVKNLLFCGSPNDVLITKFNMNITRRDIKTLYGDSWLNDEVINFYMNLLMERGEKSNQNKKYLKVYAMNTFFIPKLLQSGHSGVKRWTRKVDIFAYDIIPVPVHVGNVHWCMAIIHLKDQTIKYYDSMGQSNHNVLNALEAYLKSESVDKKKQNLDTSNWIIESERNVPQQKNCSDCGVFSCMFAEYLTRSHNITFSQSNMPYFRQKMVLEICKGKLLV